MEVTEMERRRQERRMKAELRKKKQRIRRIITLSVVAGICVAILLICLLPQKPAQKSVYRQLCDDGYTGLQEQLPFRSSISIILSEMWLFVIRRG